MRKVKDSISYCKSQYESSRQEERNLIAQKRSAEFTSGRYKEVMNLLTVLDEIVAVMNDPAQDEKSAYEKIREIIGRI